MQAEIEECVKSGFRSFKVYMAYKDSIGLNDDVLLKVMQVIGKVGGVLLVHCEMGDEIDELRDQLFKENKTSPFYHPLSRPAILEAQAVKKAIELAAKTNCALYIVHVSSEKSLSHIHEAQAKGQKVYAETCPQYLLLDDSKYNGSFKETAAYVMSPPLRKRQDKEALWKALQDGNFQTIGTDHCPFNLEQKRNGEEDFRKIPNGAGGVEHRMALLYTYGVFEGRISLNQLVELTSTNAAKIFGLYPQKGIIAEGSDADIVIWNPGTEEVISAKTHHQNNDQSIYEGIKARGSVDMIIRDGRVILENNKLCKHLSQGQLLKTNGLNNR
jgi:dihydropyrimidinase